MADGKIEIESTVDNTGAEKGLKKLAKSLKDFSNKLKSSDMANLAMSITGIGNSFKMVTGAIKTATKAVKDINDAYKVQAKAEIQLDNAIKNSPFMDGSASKALKDYASSIQAVTTYGDEQLLPFMAELVNAGRTQEQVMDIIKASTDIASSGMMDLGTAVSALNATYQGTAGTLGRQIGAIKDLSEEELRAGKAIEIVKKQFSGTAEEVAKSIGSVEQMQNAWGDLKETLGKITEPSTNNWNTFWKNRIESFNTFMGEVNKKLEKLNIDIYGKDYFGAINTRYTMEDGTEAWGAKYEKTEWLERLKLYLDEKKEKEKLNEAETQSLILITQELRIRKELETEAKAQAKAQSEANAQQSELDKSTENYNKIIAKRDATIANLKREAEALGEQVDQQAILNAEVTAYLEMATDPNLPTMTQKQLEKVQALVKAQKELTADEKKYSDFMDALSGVDLDVNKSDVLQEQLEMLDELNEAFVKSATFETLSTEKKLQIASEYAQKRKQLEKDITEAIEEESQKQKTTMEDVLNTVTNFLSQMTSILGNISEISRENTEANATIETARLKKQLEEGLIAEEEYNKKKEEIEKESARKQYEMQMWEWSANLLQIGLATAQAVMNGLQMKPAPLGLAMASTMGIAGASQLAVAIKNKPIPPSFASGGIVGGGAYSSGDNIRANVRTGEMILNDKQQLNLWRMAQGGGNGGGSTPNIEIKNYRGNDTTVTPQITEDGIRLLIRKTVADDLSNRRLNGALLSAENTMSGIKYES